jgi:hypothetical protein
MAPLVPELVVPVLKTSAPLTPSVPAFAVSITMPPLLEVELYPDFSVTDPPVFAGDAPALITSAPPTAPLPEPTVT